MKIIALFLFLIVYSQISAQYVIGEDLTTGAVKIKQFMSKNKFTLFKEGKLILKDYNDETGKYDISVDRGSELKFKEEITIDLFKNEYDNIKSIGIYINSFQNWINLLPLLDFGNWIKISKDNNSTTYTYKKYKIIEVMNLDLPSNKYQILIHPLD